MPRRHRLDTYLPRVWRSASAWASLSLHGTTGVGAGIAGDVGWGNRTVVYNRNVYVSRSVTVVNHGYYGHYDRNVAARNYNANLARTAPNYRPGYNGHYANSAAYHNSYNRTVTNNYNRNVNVNNVNRNNYNNNHVNNNYNRPTTNQHLQPAHRNNTQ